MKQRLLSIALALALLLGLLPAAALAGQAQDAQAQATGLLRPVERQTAVPAGYTGIYDPQDLAAMGDNPAGHYILMKDIDLSGLAWTPIQGADGGPFSGLLEGNGYAIRAMDCRDGRAAALFLDNAGTIQNLVLTGRASVANTEQLNGWAAGLCRDNQGTIFNCTVAAQVDDQGSSQETHLAGIAATNRGTIDHCRYTGTLTAGGGAEALAGFGLIQAGGIAQENFGTLSRCETTGLLSLTVQGAQVVAGGIAGESTGALDQCRVTGKLSVTGQADHPELTVGGLVGRNDGSLTDAAFNGKLTLSLTYADQTAPLLGTYCVGGLAGKSVAGKQVKNCYVSGTISDASTPLQGSPAWCFQEFYWGDCRTQGIYYPAGSLPPFQDLTPTSGSPAGFFAIPLTAMASQGSFSGYDFSAVWTMGQSYPVQRAFAALYPPGEEDPVTPDPGGEGLSQEEYIRQHLAFAQSSDYGLLMDQRFAQILANGQNSASANAAETAYQILNTASELSRFKTLSLFDNPYDAILTELILTATAADLDSLNTKLNTTLLDLADGLWGMVKAVQPGWTPGDYQPAIQTLLTSPKTLQESDPGLYDKLARALADYTDQAGAQKALEAISGSLNFFGKAGQVAGFLNGYTDACDWVLDCCNYYALVTAYQSLSREYVQTLRQAASAMGSGAYPAQFRAALDKYDGWLTQTWLAGAVLEEGLFGFAGLTADLLSPLTSTVMTGYLADALGLSAGTVGAVVAAYNLGWSLSNTLTGNDKIVENRELIRANHYLEEALHTILTKDRQTLLQNKDLAAAQKFDAAYLLLRASQIYSLQAYKDFLEVQQTSFSQGLLHLGSQSFNHSEITLANFAIIRWDAALCHGAAAAQEAARSQLTIACPTDVSVTNQAGAVVLAIQDGQVTTYAGGVAAGEVNGVKVLTFSGQEDYTVTITATDDGTMDCLFTTYNAAGKPTGRAVYEGLPLAFDESYTAQVSPSACQVRSAEGQQAPTRTDNGQGAVSAVTLSPQRLTLDPGEQARLTAGISPSGAAVQSLSWTSSDDTIVEVDHQGGLRALSPGVAQITTAALDGSGASARCQVTVTKAGLPFVDVEADHWFFDSVSYVFREGVMNGTSDTHFQPNATMRRAMVATVLHRMEDEPEAVYEAVFADVPPDQWFTKPVLWAYEMDIIGGYGNGLFGSQDNVTRQQLAAMLYRYAQAKDLDTSAAGDLSPFRDRDQVAPWAARAMEWAVGSGLIGGLSPTQLSPNGTATRAQCAAILTRLLTGLWEG